MVAQVRGFLCSTPVYAYGGWCFEFGYCGPWPLKKDGELRARAGRKFFKDIKPFLGMSKKEQRKHRVGGGRQPL